MRKMQSKRINGAATARLLVAFRGSPTLSFEEMTEAVAASGWALNNLLGALEKHFAFKVEGRWEPKFTRKTYTVTCWGLFDFRTIHGAQPVHSVERATNANRHSGLYRPGVMRAQNPPLGIQRDCAALPVDALGMPAVGCRGC